MSYLDDILALQQGQTTQSGSSGGVYDPRVSYDSEMGGSIPFMPSVGAGWMQGLSQFQADDGSFDAAGFNAWLRGMGYRAVEFQPGGSRFTRGIFDAQGNPVMPVESGEYEDDNFWTAAMLAAGVTGANVGLASGAFGGTEAATLASSTGGGAVGGNALTGASALTGGGGASASMPSAMSFAGSGGTAAGATSYAAPALSASGAGAATASVGAGAGAGAGTSAGMSAGQWLQALEAGTSIAGGLYGMRQAERAAERMDPFGPHRARYAQLLQDLEANPGSVSRLPGFRAGLRAIESSTAAGGYFGSGNAAAALSEFGGNFYQQELARLAQLAGAGATPGAGALGALDATGRSMASIGYGIGQLGQLLGG